MSTQAEELELYGRSIEVEPVRPLSGGGARLDVSAEGRQWRVDVSRSGTLQEVVTTWEDGNLADLDPPDWLDDALARVGRVA